MTNKMDIIISLVGLNPIPNYISILNYCKDNSKIFLIYSEKNETVSSEEVAENIEKVTLERFKDVEITKIKSSKSDFEAIINALNEVKENIGKLIDSKKEDKLKIVLDITGSTKPNAAFAYSILNDYLENNDKARFYQCYVASEKEKIYESGYEEREYLLEDLALELKVEKEEILDLHGYEKYKNNNVNINKIKNIILKDFTLIFHMKSHKEKVGELKEDMFIALDMAERLGGTLSKIFFEAKSFANIRERIDEEKGQADFIDKLENGTNRSYGNRITLKSLSDGYCSDEKIEEFIRGEA